MDALVHSTISNVQNSTIENQRVFSNCLNDAMFISYDDTWTQSEVKTWRNLVKGLLISLAIVTVGAILLPTTLIGTGCGFMLLLIGFGALTLTVGELKDLYDQRTVKKNPLNLRTY